MAIADSSSLPLAIGTQSASPHEVRLAEVTYQQRIIGTRFKRMIGDKAYDCDQLDERFRSKHRVELIAPHKRNRKSKRTQDGRAFRRYAGRWKIERLFAWFQNYRRLITRWEYKAENFLGMLHLAFILLYLKHL